MSSSRLKTSKLSDDLLFKINRKFRLQPNYIERLAIGRSLLEGQLSEKDMNIDRNGKEFNQYTLTGEKDFLYKALVAQVANCPLSDEEYFSKHLPAHIDRGLRLMGKEILDAGTQTEVIRRLIT